jgi:basic membrane lipoprotein Med (substrate-binding protein (PBP1-ABC) superfamily)
MKKLLTIAFALLLGATLSVAQAGGGSTGKPADTTQTDTGKKGHKSGKKGHKGGKKSKKNSGGTTTPPPK